jgi:hypothetical protein
MSVEAESLLLATGLLESPKRQHVLAAPILVKEMRDGMLEALDREKPARLIVYPERKTYFDRLSDEPDYASLQQDAEALVGTDIADEYVALHAKARDVLMAARPRVEIMTVLGPQPMPLDSISQGRWDLQVDVVEGARIVKDVAAGAVLSIEVEVFQACFPTLYAELRKVEDDGINKHVAKKKSWIPEPWLANSLLVFEGKKPGDKLSAAAGAPPEPGKPSKPTTSVKIKDLTKELKPEPQSA